jgi:uncharacterized protein (DUF1499 family)
MAYPRINDITTTPDSPPRFDKAKALGRNVVRTMDYPKRFASIQRASYPDLAPLRSSKSPGEVFAAALDLARGFSGWKVVAEDAASFRLEAVATTFLLRFKDDIVIEVRSESGGGCSVHMRSKSRLGRGDLGANAKRIRLFLSQLATRL